jgi:NodT family efflux transporter outer membrane factor (OMF) lipoprotein
MKNKFKCLITFSCGACVIALLIAGCAVGPDYKRPKVNVPDTYRRAQSDTNAPGGADSLGNLGWWETFRDPNLSSLLAEALTNSWDIKIAAARVLQAEAAAHITRSQFFPTVNAGGDVIASRASQNGAVTLPPGINPQRTYGDVFLSVPAYEVDVWGRIRRANEAARANLFQSIELQNTVRQTLVSDVATAYLNLLELDLELQIAQSTYEVRTNSLELTISRDQGGVGSIQDVHQARILVYTAETVITDTHRRIEQQENLLGILLGRNPGHLERANTLGLQNLPAEVPPGLPSSLLERRPDLRAAEQQLIASNADIGQAKAAFYPQLTLTGFYGYQTVALSDLFTSGSRAWQFGPAVTFPLFTGGRLRGNLRLAEARFQESLASYQRTVQGAFREVSDALIDYQRTREFTAKQEQNTQAHRDASATANDRYQGGVTSYLEVLYNEQELFSAELVLAQARRNELLSVVTLYRALGGGWQTPVQVSEVKPAPAQTR